MLPLRFCRRTLSFQERNGSVSHPRRRDVFELHHAKNHQSQHVSVIGTERDRVAQTNHLQTESNSISFCKRARFQSGNSRRQLTHIRPRPPEEYLLWPGLAFLSDTLHNGCLRAVNKQRAAALAIFTGRQEIDRQTGIPLRRKPQKWDDLPF